MEMNFNDWMVFLALVFSALSLVFSWISLRKQFFQQEIVAYPGLKNNELYLHVENTGQTLVQDFSIEIINMNEMLSDIKMNSKDKNSFKNRSGLNGKALTTLASKGRRTILLGDYKDFRIVNPETTQSFPIMSVKISYKGSKKSKTYICDYNTYKNEMIDHDVVSELREINKALRPGRA